MGITKLVVLKQVVRNHLELLQFRLNDPSRDATGTMAELMGIVEIPPIAIPHDSGVDCAWMRSAYSSDKTVMNVALSFGRYFFVVVQPDDQAPGSGHHCFPGLVLFVVFEHCFCASNDLAQPVSLPLLYGGNAGEDEIPQLLGCILGGIEE